jgi:hypothetical protein
MPATIEDVFSQFDPLEALAADDPRYVDCNKARGIPSIAERIKLWASGSPPRTLLFSGYIGDGKTTLLRWLAAQLEQKGYFVAFAQVDQRLHPSDVDVEDVILLVLAVVDQRLREVYGETLQDSLLQQRLQGLWELLTRDINAPKIEVNVPLLKLIADMKAAPGVRQELRSRLRMVQGPTFLEVTNLYLERAQQIIQDRGRKQLVVILDGFDRLFRGVPSDVSPDLRLLLDQASQLNLINAHVIYTISLSLARRQRENLSARYGNRPIVLPLIPPLQRDGQPHVEGLNALKEIIAKRLEQVGTTLAQAFDSEATVERLCQVNGGYLRGLMALVQEVCVEALAVHPELPLTRADAEVAIQHLSADLRDNAQRYLEELRTVAETHTLAKIDDAIEQLMLDQHLVHQYYDGEYWYDICEPIKKQLRGRNS